MTCKSFIAAGALYLALCPVAWAQDDMSADESRLYEAAKTERSVTWYTSQFNTEQAEQACALFTKRYPGVDCHPVRATGGVVFQRLTQELQADSVQADVISTNDLSDLVELRKGGHLASYVPENRQYMEASFNDLSTDHWSVTNIVLGGLAYNTDLIDEADAPKGWRDLVDPKWKDQIAIGHPGYSGFVGLWGLALRELYGWDYFEKLAANNPQIGRSVFDGLNLVISGERKIALVSLSNAAEQSKIGKHIRAVFPDDGAVLAPAGSSVLEKAPHPNAARLLVNFLLSKDMSEFLVSGLRYPLRSDVTPPEGLPPLADIKIITNSAEESGPRVLEVQQQFRDTFGI